MDGDLVNLLGPLFGASAPGLVYVLDLFLELSLDLGGELDPKFFHRLLFFIGQVRDDVFRFSQAYLQETLIHPLKRFVKFLKQIVNFSVSFCFKCETF